MPAADFRFSLPQLFWLTALCALFVGLLTSGDQAQQQSRPQSIAFSPDGRWLLCSLHGANSFDAKLRLWELQGNRASSRRCSFRPAGYGAGISFVTSGMLVGVSDVYAARGAGLMFWDVAKDHPVVPPLAILNQYNALFVASDAGKILLVKARNGPTTTATLLDVSDWSEQKLSDMDCYERGISADGKYILGEKISPASHSLFRIDVTSGEEVELGDAPHVNVLCNRDAKTVLLPGHQSFDLDGTTATEIRIADDGVALRSLSLANSSQVLALSPDGNLVATTNQAGELLLIDLKTEEPLHTWTDFANAIPAEWTERITPLRMWNYDYGRCAAFSPDGTRLAVATSRGVAWYDVATGARLGYLLRPRRFEQSLIYILGFWFWPFVWAYVSGRLALGRRGPVAVGQKLDPLTTLAHWGMQHGGPFVVGFGTLFLWGIVRFARPQMFADSISLLILSLLVVVVVFCILVPLELLFPGRSRLLRAKQLAKRQATIRKFSRGRYWSAEPKPSLAELNAACDDVERRFAEVTGVDVKLGRRLTIVIAETDEEFVAHSPKQPPQQYLVFRSILETSLLYSRQTIDETLFPWSRALRAGLAHLLLLKSIGQSLRPRWQTMLVLNAVAFPPARRKPALAATARAMRLVTDDMRPYFAAYLRGDPRVIEGLRQALEEQNARNFQYDVFAGIAFFCMDYFCGAEAPADRQEKFRRLLAERSATYDGQRVFETIFGFNYERLADALNTLYLSVDADWFGASTEEGQRLVSETAVRILSDPHSTQKQRERVVTGLGYCGVLRGLDLLLPLLERPDLVASEPVVAALQQLTGQAYGNEPATWRGWVDAIPLPIKLGERSGSYRDGRWSIDAPDSGMDSVASASPLVATPQVSRETSERTVPAIAPLPSAEQIELAAAHPPADLRPWVWRVLAIAAAWAVVYAVGSAFTLGPQATFPLICLCSAVYALLVVAMRDASHARLASSWLMVNLMLCDIPTALLGLVVYTQTSDTAPRTERKAVRAVR